MATLPTATLNRRVSEEYNLGPLTTTTWTQPSTCTVAIGQSGCETCNWGWRGQRCEGNGPGDNPQCWPPTSVGATSIAHPLAGWGFYSPGIICPSGYTSVTAVVAGTGGGGFDFQFPPTGSDTAIACCPSGFQAITTSWDLPRGTNHQTCIATITTVVIAGTCDTGTVRSKTIALATTVSGQLITQWEVYAPLFQIVHASSDLFTSASTSLTSALSSSTTTRTSTTSSSQTTTPMSEADPSLSTGAKAGIGVGVSLGVLGVLAMIGAFWYVRRRHTKQEAPMQYQQPGLMQYPHQPVHLQHVQQLGPMPYVQQPGPMPYVQQPSPMPHIQQQPGPVQYVQQPGSPH